MGIESAIVARLNAVVAVTNLVNNRIYADTAPIDAAHPLVIYQVISSVPVSALNLDTEHANTRIQLALIADSKTQAISLSSAIKTALQRFKGSVSDIVIKDSKLENVYDQSYDDKTQITARYLDFLITHT